MNDLDLAAAGARVDRRRALLHVLVAYAAGLAAAMAAGALLRGRHPILVAAAADVAGTAAVFLFSVLHDNSSVYDPYWSVAPLPIGLYWALQGPLGPRAGLVLLLLFAWGARLTWNWAQRWGGMGDEDFRYVELRAKAGRAYWALSFAGIHLAPTAWVFLGMLPLWPALSSAAPLGALDLAAALVAALAIGIETSADWELRAFRRRRRNSAEVLSTGVWAYSRHPNYFGEVLFWWGLYLFGVSAAPPWAWSAVGPLSITLLFVFVSTPWMDRRMLARHPAFAERLRTTSALVPWPRRRAG